MRFTLDTQGEHIVTVMRRLGYVFQHQQENELSFVRPLARAGFPRFHCYAQTGTDRVLLSIHLDQKRETYGKTTRHHGEYENEGALKEELSRIEAGVGNISLLA